MTSFAALHHTGTPLLLPNAWDHASAVALARLGFPAIGTTSLGVAAAAGLPDGTAASKGETLLLARRLGKGPFLLSVDAEGGFNDDPTEVAEMGPANWLPPGQSASTWRTAEATARSPLCMCTRRRSRR
ncbi:MAG: hypothetical protein QOE61_4273 [Micromonosporaceae bacterium]|nr:hypothetical protein [Micromonosporaceae bacterium]